MIALVTGSEGFIAKHLIRALEERGDKVFGLDRKKGWLDINNCLLPEADIVYHLAAQTDAYNLNMWQNIEDNINATTRVCYYYKDKVIHASSSMVNYPFNPYAITKAAAESIALFYGAKVVRFCNIYGEGGHSVIDKFEKADELTIYGDGKQMRTYEHVSNAVEMMLAPTDQKIRLLHGRDLSVLDIAQFYHKNIKYEPARPGDLQWACQ